MPLLHLFDLLWEVLHPQNLKECFLSLPYMGMITLRSLSRRRIQTLLTIVAVSLGFSAYLCLLVVFGADAANAAERIADVNLPATVIVRQQPGLSLKQVSQLEESHLVEALQPAIELTAHFATEQTRIMGFSPDSSFWQRRVRVVAGQQDLSREGIALPQTLALLLDVTIGDNIDVVTYAGASGPVNRATMHIETLFTSEYALFDRPVALCDSAIFQGYDIEQPSLLFLECPESFGKQVTKVVRQALFVGMDDRSYPWLKESPLSPAWISKAKQPYSILWQQHGESFYLDMAKDVVHNNYTSANRLVWLIYAFSALCVFSILLITLLTRRRDIGILKSVGFDDIDIFTSFVLEAAIVSGGGVLLGISISQLAASVLSHFTGYALSIGLAQVTKAATLSFFLYLLAAMVPADMARYTPTIDLLREGGLFNRWRESGLVLSVPHLVDRNRRF